MVARAKSVAELLLWLAGPIVWTVHFAFMYMAETLFCFGPGAASRSGQFAFIAAASTALALLGLAGFVAWRIKSKIQGDDDGSAFLRATSIALAALAMLGVLWVAAPALLVRACTAN